MTYKKNTGIFAVVSHTFKIHNPRDGKMDSFEHCEFVTHLKKKHIQSASIILDLTNKEVRKDRSNQGDFKSFILYIKETFDTEYIELLKRTNLTDEYLIN